MINKQKITSLIKKKLAEYKWGETSEYEYGQEPGWWKGQLAAEDAIPGGKGDKLSIDDVDKEELKKGLRVEMEHTTDPKIAVEIALDHLAEDPKYYTNLEKVHKESVNESLITEGVNDPNILKAVFLAGGPGSGKSYTVSQVFGVPEDITRGTTSLGLKVINSDAAFENNLKKAGVNPKNLGKMADSIFKFYTTGNDSARNKAKVATKKLQNMFEQGRLGLIIDGTGHDYAKIDKMKKRLEALGYDTSMLFVNTSLDVAKERNSKRDRVLPDDLLVHSWKEVQNNMGKFQSLFGNNFQILDNSEIGDFNAMHKRKINTINKIVKQPVKNPIGKQWIEAEKKLRNIK